MIERIVILENVDPVVFFGINNSNVQLLKTLFPKLRIVARGNVIKVIGDENELNTFEEKVHELEKFSIEMNLLKEEDILDIVKGKAPTVVNQDNLIIHGLNGKPILARTANQKKLVDAFGTNDLVFAIGPAGSGKTYTAIALAVRALKTKQVRKIILSRPAVEAGEKLGFLPGDMKEKIDPYLQPLYDALEDMIPPLETQGVYRKQDYPDRTARLYARTHTERCDNHPRRGAKHHQTADQDVSYPAGTEREDDRHRRRDADRPAHLPAVGPDPLDEPAEGDQGDLHGRV
jgi:phosphate starvation-inducible protein PhoH